MKSIFFFMATQHGHNSNLGGVGLQILEKFQFGDIVRCPVVVKDASCVTRVGVQRPVERGGLMQRFQVRSVPKMPIHVLPREEATRFAKNDHVVEPLLQKAEPFVEFIVSVANRNVPKHRHAVGVRTEDDVVAGQIQLVCQPFETSAPARIVVLDALHEKHATIVGVPFMDVMHEIVDDATPLVPRGGAVRFVLDVDAHQVRVVHDTVEQSVPRLDKLVPREVAVRMLRNDGADGVKVHHDEDVACQCLVKHAFQQGSRSGTARIRLGVDALWIRGTVQIPGQFVGERETNGVELVVCDEIHVKVKIVCPQSVRCPAIGLKP